MNEEQVKLWNGPAGAAWVESQQLLDATFEPFERMLADAAVQARARSVLDVGCGTGATTLAISRALGPRARCVGLDLSAPMVDLARARATRAGLPAEFVVADAQVAPCGPSRFDLIVSRFGVMFFGDPVAAFANLRLAAEAGAALCCLVFRSAAENPFMTTAERAAAPLLPALPPRRPEAPGQFAFAQDARVRGILSAAGWRQVTLRPVDVECAFAARELTGYFTRLGPVGLALQQAEPDTRQQVIAAVRAAFAPFVRGDEVRFNAACWMIEARA